MSYCTVAELGQLQRARGATASPAEASLEIIRAVETAINTYLGFNGLYEPSSTWRVDDTVAIEQPDDTTRVYLGHRVIELDTVVVYVNGFKAKTYTPSVMLDDRWWSATDFPRIYGKYSWNVMLFVTGSRGHAQFSGLKAGDALRAGQSILRGGGLMLIGADAEAQADDKLVTPPPELNHMAIVIGRMLMALERGQAFLDGDHHGILTDSMKRTLKEYRQ